MAEDTTVESPPEVGGGENLESLRQELADKQEELVGLRAEREQAQRAAVQKVEAAQVQRQIDLVEREIENEKSMLATQQGLDPVLVGTGVPSEPVEAEELVDPEAVAEKLAAGEDLGTVEFGEAAQPVAQPTPDQPEGDAEVTTEGSEH